MHTTVDLKVLYFGTPVVLLGTRNPDGMPNLAPLSSAWWLGRSAMLGLGDHSRSAANLRRTGEGVLNLVPAALAAAVDRLALTTGRPDVPAYKRAMGYRWVADTFAAAGLTAQDGELVAAPRVAECPIQLECRVAAGRPFGAAAVDATAWELAVLRCHVDDRVRVPGTAYVDPLRWDPLIMKFTEFFGGGRPLRGSRLAAAWDVPPLGGMLAG